MPVRLVSLRWVSLLGTTQGLVTLTGWRRWRPARVAWSSRAATRGPASEEDEGWCAMEVPCSLWSRVEEGALGKAAETAEEQERAREYGAEALRLGLGLLDRARASSEVSAVSGEVASLLGKLEAWDAATRERLSRTWAESEARQASTLEKYLGERGALEASVSRLRSELSDPRVASSIPAATASAVTEAVSAAVADVKRAVDASDEASALSKFLRASRADSAQLRIDLERRQERFAAELKAELRDLVLPGTELSSPETKGRAFELEVSDALARLAAAEGDAVRDVSLEAARGSLAKVGDLTVDFEAASLAVEVKAGAFALGGQRSIEKQIRDAMALSGCAVGLGVVRAAHLPKKLGWYTPLRDDVVIVAFEPDLDYGHVALDCAFKVLRAKALADAADARLDRRDDAPHPDDDSRLALARLANEANHRASAIAARATDVLANLDRLRRMKKNSTDLINMLTILRQDLDNLDRDIRDNLRAMDLDLHPLLHLRAAHAKPRPAHLADPAPPS